MEKKKLNLKEIGVKSFITNLNSTNKNTIVGGHEPTDGGMTCWVPLLEPLHPALEGVTMTYEILEVGVTVGQILASGAARKGGGCANTSYGGGNGNNTQSDLNNICSRIGCNGYSNILGHETGC